MKNYLFSLALLCSAFLFSSAVLAIPYSNLYVVGDSLSDTGNLFTATDFLTGAGAPADDHYWNGRFANGEVYSGLLAQKLGVTLAPSILGGNNFSYGGARSYYNVVEVDSSKPAFAPQGGVLPEDAFSWTLNSQQQAFESRGINDPNGLYVLFFGSNEISDLVGPALNGFNVVPYMDNMLLGMQGVIEAYIAAGAHDIIVPNVPDLGLVPRVFGLDPLPGAPPNLVAMTATSLAYQYNIMLATLLDSYVDVNIIQFDTFGFLTEIASDPAAFGFVDATSFCYSGFVLPNDGSQTVCPNPDELIYWDDEHPTTALHALLADRFYAAAVPEPSTLALFMLGVVGMVLFSQKSRKDLPQYNTVNLLE